MRSVVCPKLNLRNGKRVQEVEGACARCRICVDNEHITQILFPEHKARGHRGATGALFKVFAEARKEEVVYE